MKTFLIMLMLVESNLDPSAIGDGGRAVGILQIHPILVHDINRIYGTSYTLEDRFNIQHSVDMACLYFRHYLGPRATPEEMARLWNSGPGWKNKKHLTDSYLHRLKNLINEQVY